MAKATKTEAAPVAETASKFQILNRISGALQFECELSAEIAGQSYGFRLGFAVKKAIKAKADLRSADLRSADLRSANLRSADLRYANLRSADLRYANLRYGNLRYADLSYANLRSADLRYANLRYANLRSADLRYADLRSADLRYADLRYANLRYADLSYANLRYANLRSADLSYANNAELAIALTRILPDGSLIRWKKCQNNVIVKLRIPEEAKRSHAFGRKCRAEFADVVEVIGADFGISLYDGETKYEAGARVTPSAFDEDWSAECSSGVHFYISRIEAENHR